MTIHLITLKNVSIYDQLLLEEQLIRGDDQNYLIINEGSPKAIVMGISSKAEELIDLKKANDLNIPVLRRYSGGGTVLIQEDTLLTSFIFHKASFPFSPFPEPLLMWSASFFKDAFGINNFCLKEQDYALDCRKCAGNAQYITKDRLVHHTSFLWNFCPDLMQVLLYPKKTPTYRDGRSHKEFLCSLSSHFSSLEFLKQNIVGQLRKTWDVKHVTKEDLKDVLSKKVRIATHWIKSPPDGF